MFGRAPGIGLDIGSKKIKLVKLKNKKNDTYLDVFGSIFTPSGTMDKGGITDPERLGKEINRLVADMGLRSKKVVASVSGPQAYTRNIIIPRMPLNELRQAVFFKATAFLPIPPAEAVIDIFPLRNFTDEEGEKIEIFFAATRRLQLDNLKLTCKIAGLKLAAIDIEQLALNRIFHKKHGPIAYVNIGAHRSHFSIFQNGVPLLNRSLSLGCSEFLESKNTGNLHTLSIKPSTSALNPNSTYEHFWRNIVAELTRSIEYFTMQTHGELHKIYLCGGGSRLKSLDSILQEKLNLPVEIGDPLEKLNLPPHITEQEKTELRHDFPVALGLAMRKVI